MSNITIKTIQARLGVAVTGEFIVETLGVQPVEKEKRSVFWTEAQYIEIVDKLIAHFQANKGNKTIAPKPEPKKKDEAAAPAPAAGGFNFGAPAVAPTPAPAPAATGFNFGAPAAAAPAPAAGQFNFGGETPAQAPAASGFNF